MSQDRKKPQADEQPVSALHGVPAGSQRDPSPKTIRRHPDKMTRPGMVRGYQTK